MPPAMHSPPSGCTRQSGPGTARLGSPRRRLSTGSSPPPRRITSRRLGSLNSPQGGAIVTDLHAAASPVASSASLPDIDPRTGSDTEIDAEVETVSGRFLDLPGAFMPMRTRADRALRDGEDWDSIVYDHINPHHGTTEIDPCAARRQPLAGSAHPAAPGRTPNTLASPDPSTTPSCPARTSTRQLVQREPHTRPPWPLRRHPGRTAPPGGTTLEVAHTTWKRLGAPGVERFGIIHRPGRVLHPALCVVLTTRTPATGGPVPPEGRNTRW